MPIASHSEAVRGDSKLAKTGPMVKMLVSTTLVHPKPEKGLKVLNTELILILSNHKVDSNKTSMRGS